MSDEWRIKLIRLNLTSWFFHEDDFTHEVIVELLAKVGTRGLLNAILQKVDESVCSELLNHPNDSCFAYFSGFDEDDAECALGTIGLQIGADFEAELDISAALKWSLDMISDGSGVIPPSDHVSILRARLLRGEFLRLADILAHAVGDG
jgi:hypothetical protein